MKYFVAAVTAVILAIVVVALFYVGSPQEVRLREFDQLRVQHLSNIQQNLLEYWQAKEDLPEGLDALPDEVRYVEVPVDPQTNEGYEYTRLTEVSFELCATFNVPSDDNLTNEFLDRSYQPYTVLPFGKDATWEHDAGRTCFTRTIDPDFFKKNE